MRRLSMVNARLGVAQKGPAFAKGPDCKTVWTGAGMMKHLIFPALEQIRDDAVPPMRSTFYLKSVDWSRIRARSFRRTGIHRLRVAGVKPHIVDYFGRWKNRWVAPMQVRHDMLAIEESVEVSSRL